MPSLIQYLLKLSISLALVWLFYQLVLRRLTFYNWNRCFLLGYSVLAFFIPLINIAPALEQTTLVKNKVVQLIPTVDKFTGVERTLYFDKWDWVLAFVGAGCLALLLRLVTQHISFLRLCRSAKLILGTPVKVYEVDDKITPFSFGNAIFINQVQHSEEEIKEIIKHEFVHVQQKHSFDVLCAEWLCILNWYNPFAWLIRHSIRQNLEFIADSKVVQNGIDKKQYQYLLLKVIGVSQYSMATNFNFSSLKKRIAMMNKMKSAKVHLIKFLFLLPLIAAMLLAFRNKSSNQRTKPLVVAHEHVMDTVPVRPALPAKPGFPENVASISNSDNQVTVTLKDGTKEKYNLNKAEERAAFEKKYGELAEPPSPPEAPTAPIPPTPHLPSNVSAIHVHNDKATIKLKNGKVETFDLSKPAEKQTFEKKYGDVMPVAPKPPTPPKPPTAAAVASTMIVTGLEPTVSVDVSEPVVSVSTTLSADIIDVQPSVNVVSPVKNEEVIVEITKQTSKERIEEIKKELSLKGVTLSINNTKFNASGLQSIDGVIADDETKSRFTAEGFSKIIIKQVKYNNAKSEFHIRILDGIIKM